MDVIRRVMEDSTLSPTEKVLFAILYCQKKGNSCQLSVEEVIKQVGVELESVLGSLQGLEEGGFIKLDEGCRVNNATDFISCAVLVRNQTSGDPEVPRP